MSTAAALREVLDDEIRVLGELLEMLQADQERIVRVDGMDFGQRLPGVGNLAVDFA